MLRDIAGIRLCGANFDEVTNILLLDPHEGNKVKPVKGTYTKNNSKLQKQLKKQKEEMTANGTVSFFSKASFQRKRSDSG